MAVLYLSVDCGGSQTKIVYQLSGAESPGYLLMSPLVEEIKPEKIVTYLDRKSSLGSPAPDREAYLKWQERVFVVGDLHGGGVVHGLHRGFGGVEKRYVEFESSLHGGFWRG